MADQLDRPSGAGTPAPASSAGVLPEQWPAQAADAIVKVVGQVRDRTTGPAITAARAVVYGLFAAVLGTVALVLVCILVIRLGANYIPGGVWCVYLGLGSVLTVGGLGLWRKAFAGSPTDG